MKEANISWFCGLAGGIGSWWFVYGLECKALTALYETVLPQTISVASILAGFQATLQAILLTLRQGKAVKEIRESGEYNNLINYISTATNLLLLYVVVSLALVTLPAFASESHWLLIFAGGLLASAFGATWRVTRIMFGILAYEQRST